MIDWAKILADKFTNIYGVIITRYSDHPQYDIRNRDIFVTWCNSGYLYMCVADTFDKWDNCPVIMKVDEIDFDKVLEYIKLMKDNHINENYYKIIDERII